MGLCGNFTKILSRKPRVFLKNLTDWHDESLQYCCHIITRSRLKLSQSLAMFTLLYSPWDPYKLCWKKIYLLLFYMSIFYFSICLSSNKLYWIEDQLANTQFYTSISYISKLALVATYMTGTRYSLFSEVILVTAITNRGGQLYFSLMVH